MRKYLPYFLKSIIRFLYYRNERKKVIREFSIRKTQNKLIEQEYSSNTRKLIVFMVDGASWFTGKDQISGGILSIASIYEETKKLENLHNSKVIMVTAPNAHLLLKHTQFPNDINVYRFEQLKRFQEINEVLIHIPEYKFENKLVQTIRSSFNSIPVDCIHLNILNQRIDIMPVPEIIQNINKQGFKITQTTAHEKYSTHAIRKKFGVPLHKLSVYATPERYNFTPYQEKQNLILVSPDEVENKNNILKRISDELPQFKIQVINNITYLEYLSLTEKAKYMLTFGEGLDFYFIETVFSGGVSFAVYNNQFFTDAFKDLKGLFNSYEEMEKNIITYIKSLEEQPDEYKITNKRQFEQCHQIYNEKFYKNNLVDFYNEKYLYP